MGMNNRLLRPRQSGLNPRSISGLALWLDAADSSTLFQDAAATIPATATNDPVGAWRNKAAAGGTFTQSTSTMRPALTGGYQNGKPAIVSDGVDDWLSASPASIGVASAAAATGVFVTRRAAAGSAAGWDFGTNLSGQQSAGSGLVYDDFFRSVRTPGTFSGQTASITSITSPGSGGRGWRINGAQMSFVDSGAFAVPATAYVLGGPTFPSGFTSFGGGMCEALIYTRVLSEAEVAALERYLASKWGITLAPQVSNADAQDWVNRVYANGGTVSATTASAVNTFCNAIDAAGIRDRFYRLNLFCGASDANLNAVRTPLYRGPSLGGTQHGNTTDTNVNFVQGDYAETGASGGLTGNAAVGKYLNTGFQPFASGSAIAAYGHGSVWAMTLPSSRLNVMGCRRETAPSAFAGGQLDNTGKAWMGWDSATGISGQGAASAPFLGVVSRRSDNRVYWSVNGSAVADAASTAAGTTTANYGVFGNLFDTGSTALATLRIAGYSIGAELSASQQSALYSAWLAFQQSLGRIV